MRSIVEEYGFVIITALVCIVVVAVILMGVLLPQITGEIERNFPDESSAISVDVSNATTNAQRKPPVITVNNVTTLMVVGGIIRFDTYISNGSANDTSKPYIKAVNADNKNVSANITVKPYDAFTAAAYDETTGVYRPKYVGTYTFQIIANDVVNGVRYGRNSVKLITIAVR